MTDAPALRVLKESGRRSVRLETAPDGERIVVKRFASRTLAGATLDRARAAREHRMLAELHGRGLAVPRPLALERRDGAWEVRMQWIDGAAALSEILAGRAEWPVEPGRAARALGVLLARLHAAGLDHADLHAGNALLDASGAAWAIDFHKARRVRRLRGKTLVRDLVSLAAGAREALGPRFRARFLLAWLRELPAGLSACLPDRAELAAAAERDARERRIGVVRHRRARWLRSGTACATVREPFRGLARRGAAIELVRELAREALARDGAPRAELATVRAPSGSAELAGDVFLLVTGLARAELLASWTAAARLEEHGLAAARPVAISVEPRPWIALALPGGSCACVEPSRIRSRRALRSLGRLCARLADRGVAPTPSAWPLLWTGPDGEVRIGVAAELEHEPRAGSGVDTVRALALAGLSVGELGASERAAFALGILEGVPLGQVARARLRADLRHG